MGVSGGSCGRSRGGAIGCWGVVGVVGGAEGLCYAPNNLKKSQFYVILWGILWWLVGDVGGGAWGVCVT